MGGDVKYPLAVAAAVADELVKLIEPVCERIIVAGSIRRKKPQVGDVEIVYIPKFTSRKVDMFNESRFNLVDEQLQTMIQSGVLIVRGGWGEKNKFAIHTKSGIPVDLFSTTVENWWVTMTFRTGGKTNNLKLTTGANRIGRSLNAYGCGVTCSDNSVIPATSERHVFELCKVDYKEPEDRE